MSVQFAIMPIKPGPGTRKELENRAVRELIARHIGCNLMPGHSPEGAPELPGADKHISISHSRYFAALAWADTPGIGIDIEEKRHEQLNRVAHRFMTSEETLYYSAIPDGFLRAWTLKEAAFKALRNGPADLRQYRLPLSPADDTIIAGHRRLSILKSEMVTEELCLAVVREIVAHDIQNRD